MYTYSAAIPEELTFAKGDILAVLRLQDDGWWEAEEEIPSGLGAKQLSDEDLRSLVEAVKLEGHEKGCKYALLSLSSSSSARGC
jgi:hypothetical protein